MGLHIIFMYISICSQYFSVLKYRIIKSNKIKRFFFQVYDTSCSCCTIKFNFCSKTVNFVAEPASACIHKTARGSVHRDGPCKHSVQGHLKRYKPHGDPLHCCLMPSSCCVLLFFFLLFCSFVKEILPPEQCTCVTQHVVLYRLLY